MRVLSELDTVLRVLEHGLGLSRFGRCELRLIQGRKALAQVPDPGLQRRLAGILKDRTVPRHTLVCVPRVFEEMAPGKARYYAEFCQEPTRSALFDPEIPYGSTFATRRDGWQGDSLGDRTETDYWELWRSLWDGRPVLVVAGSDKGRVAAAKGGLLVNAGAVTTIASVPRDAWSQADELRDLCLRWAERAKEAQQRPLVYLALGATAAVLAYDLGEQGVQAIDAGHLAQSWLKVDMKSPQARAERIALQQVVAG